MTQHADLLRQIFCHGPTTTRQIVEKTGLSQPTVSRALTSLGDEVLRIGSGPSIHYVLRDYSRSFGSVAINRVTNQGQARLLGELIPVRPHGFVMVQADGITIHSDGLPWWLLDMRPQGYLGRAYALAHAANLGLHSNPDSWTDSEVIRSLISHGHDAVGNLLVGERARDRFIAMLSPVPVADRHVEYPRLANSATAGDTPGSSAGGEQPKFCAYTEQGHVLVKFSARDDNPVSERWRDLLLAEHHALAVLGVNSEIIDADGQRFLEVPRFDRVGELGRIGVFSLRALDAEFVGDAISPWPSIVARLAAAGHVEPGSVANAARLWAFGVLIGNTDMHGGNLSFISCQGPPYRLAPAYDMLPMGFAPRSGGSLVNTLAPATLSSIVSGETWREALSLANSFTRRIRHTTGFSTHFQPCIEALCFHADEAARRIARIG